MDRKTLKIKAKPVVEGKPRMLENVYKDVIQYMGSRIIEAQIGIQSNGYDQDTIEQEEKVQINGDFFESFSLNSHIVF